MSLHKNTKRLCQKIIFSIITTGILWISYDFLLKLGHFQQKFLLLIAFVVLFSISTTGILGDKIKINRKNQLVIPIVSGFLALLVYFLQFPSDLRSDGVLGFFIISFVTSFIFLRFMKIDDYKSIFLRIYLLSSILSFFFTSISWLLENSHYNNPILALIIMPLVPFILIFLLASLFTFFTWPLAIFVYFKKPSRVNIFYILSMLGTCTIIFGFLFEYLSIN